MKKIMKAIAFATVMCLALSTAAFAAVDVDLDTKAVDITVETAQKGEQVALIIVEAGATEFTSETILFVDQNATGEFATSLATADVKAIDVYAGYASNGTGKAVLVADNVELEKEEEVLVLKITLEDVQLVNDLTVIAIDNKGSTSNAWEGTKGAVVYFKLNAENVEEGDIAGMNWAFEVKNDETGEVKTKYAKAEETIVAALGTILTGDVEIAAAINSTGYTVTDAHAVFSVKGEVVEVVKE